MEVSSLLQDYLALYKKEVKNDHPRRSSQKKEKRSKSKGTSHHTDKKPKHIVEELKEENHAKEILERWERALTILQEEVEDLRRELVEKEGII